MPKCLAGLLLIFVLVACQTQAGSPVAEPNAGLSGGPQASPTRTPFQPVPWTDTPAPSLTPASTASPTPPPYRLWSDARLPAGFQQAIGVPASFGPAANPETATHQITISAQNPASYWVYALVGPFHTISDGIPAQALLDFWSGHPNEYFEADLLWMTPETLALLSAWWGTPVQAGIHTANAEQLLDQVWGKPRAWAIVSFEELEPRWKVLAIDGLSPLDQEFDQRDYELAIPFSLLGDPATGLTLPAGNRDDDRITHLVMTGVTALVRATAFTMERQGITYPATEVGAFLQAADITHISNEVPFAEDCPYPNPTQPDMRFCSNPAYIELLEAVGTDVVELTGDHFADWGSAAMLFTLQQYTDRGWLFYGGGENLESARQAALITDHGNPIAFIGCNAKGGSFAQASNSNPGAAACDFEWLEAEIQKLHQLGYLVIGTFQHFEYYTYAAQPNQVKDAARLIEAGATLVSGSQAHQPQAFEFVNGRLVHHGLGNLFFDQYDLSEPARQAFIDEHIFYQGRHINTRLITIYFIDYARPRIMTPAERANLLETVFAASGW